MGEAKDRSPNAEARRAEAAAREVWAARCAAAAEVVADAAAIIHVVDQVVQQERDAGVYAKLVAALTSGTTSEGQVQRDRRADLLRVSAQLVGASLLPDEDDEDEGGEDDYPETLLPPPDPKKPDADFLVRPPRPDLLPPG